MYYLKWLCSRQIRQASELCQQARKVLNAQRDLLGENAIREVTQAVEALRTAIRSGADASEIDERMASLEKAGAAWLKPYPNPSLRENVEVFLVAGAVALAVRTFFLQPMAIPTGSAQPTFFGITYENYAGQADVEFPTGLKKWYKSWVRGDWYYHVVAREPGVLQIIDKEPRRVLLFLKKQRFRVGDEQYTIWSPPDALWKETGLRSGEYFRQGEDIIKLRVGSGDHLFVDRFTYNFRRPKRGETIVFASTGIDRIIQNTHYIKRLVALGGDKVQIGNDRHVRINGRRLTAADPGFEHVYGFDGPPEVDEYSGHVNGYIAAIHGKGGLASLFPSENTTFKVRPKHYLTFGDNTMNSFDSRDWGDFPRDKVIGKSFFVFWPITERFGWGRK